METLHCLDSRSCENCGRVFKVLPTSSQKYCSSMCSLDANPARVGLAGVVQRRDEQKRKNFKKAGLKVVQSVVGKSVNNISNVVKNDHPIKTNQELEFERWMGYVERGKNIVRTMSKNRMELAKITLEVCDVFRGGGNHWSGFDSVNTIKKFSKEINIHYKTLTRYCDIYRNVIKQLPEDQWDEDYDFAVLTRTYNKVNKKTPKEDVRRIFNQELSRKGSGVTLHTLIKRIGTAKYYILNLDLNDFEVDDLRELKSVCTEINEKLENHLKGLDSGSF